MISKTTISSIDPYSISQMEFNIKNASKHTTLKSLIATIAIFVLTVLINLETLNQILLQRWELPIKQSKVLYDRNLMPLYTNFPVCFENHNISDSRVPSVLALDGFNQSVPLMSHQQVRIQFPQIAKKLKSEKYECVNFANRTHFNNRDEQSLFMTTDLTNITLHIRFTNIKSKRYGTEPQIFSMINDKFGLRKGLQFTVLTGKFIYQDELAIQYVPKVEFEPLDQKYYFYFATVLGSRPVMNATVIFESNANYPASYYDNYFSSIEYTICRKNIGQILGKLFAWYSIFLLAFVTLIGPIVEFSLNVELVKTLYSHDYLNSMQSSIVSQIKFYISSLCTSCIRQRILSVAFGRLAKDMDILNLLKKQIMMKRISKQLRYSENQIELYVPDFEYDKNQDKELLQKDEDSESDEQKTVQPKGETAFEVGQDSQGQLSFSRLMGRLFEMLDFSQVKVGLLYNKGKPMGSIWSILVTVLGIGGLVAFLLLTGATSIKTNDTMFTQIISKDTQSKETQHWIGSEQILFRLERTSGSTNLTITFHMRNSATQIVENITMNTGENCHHVMQLMGFESGLFMYCLPPGKKIRLFATEDNFNSFGLLYTQSSPGTVKTTCYIRQARWQPDFITAKTTAFIFNNMPTSSMSLYKLRLLKLQDQPENHHLTYRYVPDGSDYTFYPEVGRILGFRIDNHKNVFKRNKSTIWDVIDSTWVVILLVFQVIVFKVSRAINSRVKKGQSNTDRERERSNIINILANHDRLINGSFRKEMHAARYYFKENLSITDVGR